MCLPKPSSIKAASSTNGRQMSLMQETQVLKLSKLTGESLFAAHFKALYNMMTVSEHCKLIRRNIATTKHQAAADEEDVLAKGVIGKSPTSVERPSMSQQSDDTRAGSKWTHIAIRASTYDDRPAICCSAGLHLLRLKIPVHAIISLYWSPCDIDAYTINCWSGHLMSKGACIPPYNNIHLGGAVPRSLNAFLDDES